MPHRFPLLAPQSPALGVVSTSPISTGRLWFWGLVSVFPTVRHSKSVAPRVEAPMVIGFPRPPIPPMRGRC